MESGVKQRVIDLAENKAESICGFAKAINVAQTTLSEYLNNGKIPSFKVVNGILEAYPDVSAEWLLRGEGAMYKTTELPPVDVSSEESIEHSAEIARLVREKNEMADIIENQKEEIIRLQAQIEILKDVLRESMSIDPVQKVG
jgi:transcriptional regulator with XRE-family HTH domain